MKTIGLTEENINDYSGLIDTDVCEDIMRRSVRGIAVCDEDSGAPGGIIIWESHAAGEGAAQAARILHLWFADKEWAKKLLNEYTAEADKRNIKETVFEFSRTGALDGPVPGGCSSPEEKISFLKAAGFEITEGTGRDILVPLSDFSDFAVLLEKEPSAFVTNIDELMVEQFRQGLGACTAGGNRGYMDEIEDYPMCYFDMDVSGSVVRGGIVEGLLLVHELPSGRLVIDYMQAVGDNAREDIFDLLRFSYRAALEKYSTDTGVVLRLHNRIVTALVDKIFPGKKGDEIYIARRVNNA